MAGRGEKGTACVWETGVDRTNFKTFHWFIYLFIYLFIPTFLLNRNGIFHYVFIDYVHQALKSSTNGFSEWFPCLTLTLTPSCFEHVVELVRTQRTKRLAAFVSRLSKRTCEMFLMEGRIPSIPHVRYSALYLWKIRVTFKTAQKPTFVQISIGTLDGNWIQRSNRKWVHGLDGYFWWPAVLSNYFLLQNSGTWRGFFFGFFLLFYYCFHNIVYIYLFFLPLCYLRRIIFRCSLTVSSLIILPSR